VRLKLQRIRPHQTRFVDSLKRFIFNSGGAGSGKTLGNIFKIFALAFKHPGIMIGFGGHDMPFLRRTIMRELEALVPESAWRDVNKRDHIYTFPNNSKVQFLPLYSEAVLKSFTCGAFGFEEITEIRDESIFNRVITILRQPGMPGTVFGATNPGPFTHWFYKRFIDLVPDLRVHLRRERPPLVERVGRITIERDDLDHLIARVELDDLLYLRRHVPVLL